MSLYVINILASRDLTEIADYFAETNVEVGERFFKEFNSKGAMVLGSIDVDDYRSNLKINFITDSLAVGGQLLVGVAYRR
jgi:hypothetical protein